jgi:Ser/Thr protein kinase RdoA (MazF antagonist)
LVHNGKISGILDFGDMILGVLASEVAVAMTYIMFKKDDPLEAGSWLLKGYHE